jgi:hypothetical protein
MAAQQPTRVTLDGCAGKRRIEDVRIGEIAWMSMLLAFLFSG